MYSFIHTSEEEKYESVNVLTSKNVFLTMAYNLLKYCL